MRSANRSASCRAWRCSTVAKEQAKADRARDDAEGARRHTEGGACIKCTGQGTEKRLLRRVLLSVG